MNTIKRNGIKISVEDWTNMRLKKPVLSVYIEDENCAYKVASFNSVETAKWFCELMDEFFDDMTAWRHGAWRWAGGVEAYACSECGHYADSMTSRLPNYCGFCGARMDGEHHDAQ